MIPHEHHQEVSAERDDVFQGLPDSAQDVFRQISEACYTVADEITRRCSDRLPGLREAFIDRGMVSVGGHFKGPLGTYQWDKWEIEERLYDEIHINIGHLIYSDTPIHARAERITTTIGHELAHLYAEATGIRDTSGRGNRYHNRRFAEIALQLGLRVERSARSYIGFTTPGLSSQGREELADLASMIADVLRLTPAANSLVASMPASLILATMTPGTDDPVRTEASSKYVSARCGCRDARGRHKAIRIARGWWQPQTITCSVCTLPFTESPPNRTNSSATGAGS